MSKKYCLPVKSTLEKYDLMYINTHIQNSILQNFAVLAIATCIWPAAFIKMAQFTVSMILSIAVSQGFAIDILGINRQSLSTSASGNPNLKSTYYIYGAQVYASDDGEVIETKTSVKESTFTKLSIANIAAIFSLTAALIPWSTIFNLLGNYVIIKHKNGTYSLYAHLKYNSITVKKGDKIKSGKIIGEVGNTGNSTEPHLHFQICQFNPKWIALMQDINLYTALASMKTLSIPAMIPNTFSLPLENFETHKYIPLTKSDQVFIGSVEDIYNKITNEDLIMDVIRNGDWKINNTGKIHPFCIINGK